MPHFPQLSTGALAQFPITKRITTRTIRHEVPGGYTVSISDPSAAMIEWDLNLSDLLPEEHSGLLALFENVEGRLFPFTFLDPLANLLLWSEDLSNVAWSKDPLIHTSAGISDPKGSMNAARLANAGAALQRIKQTTSVPASYRYSLSVWLRSDVNTTASLFSESQGDSSISNHAVTPAWERFSLSFKLNSSSENLTVGLGLPSGHSVDVFGFQLDAQPAPAEYRKSTSKSGVYSSARFRDDRLESVATGRFRYAVKLAIVSPA